MKQAALSRADLIRWASHLNEVRLRRLAEGLGYKEARETASEPETRARAGLAPRKVPGAFTTPTIATDTGEDRHRQYRLVERRPLVPRPVSRSVPAAVPPEEPASPLGPPPPPPLVPWPRLWPLLRAALGERAERHRIDLPRVVAAVSRARPLRRLPRLKGPGWAPRGQLILDLHPRLYPFWGDFHALKEALPRLRGAVGLDIVRMDEGPAGPVQTWDGRVWGPPRPYSPPPAGTPVLIAGDLGCLGSPVLRLAWIGFGRCLAATGLLPVALTPCPARLWDPALAGLFYPVTLDRAARIPTKSTGPRPWPSQPVDLTEAIQRDTGARRLLTLLSASIAITPALLRHLRYLLPVGLADVGSEVAAWLHPAFVAGDFALLPGDPAQIEHLRESFRRIEEVDHSHLAWRLIRAQQQTGATRAERMEERVLYAAAQGRVDSQAEAFLYRVAEALDQAREQPGGEHARFLTNWIDRRADRMHRSAWAASPRSEILWLLAHPEAEEEGAAVPAGFDIHRAMAGLDRPEEPRSWRLVQRGERLEIEAEGEDDRGRPLAGFSPVVEFATRRPVMQIRELSAGSAETSLLLRDGAAMPLNESGYWLRTDSDELVIEPVTRPAWARALGRDGDGLFVDFNDGRSQRRAYWWNPGLYNWLGEHGESVGDLGLQEGRFVDQAQFRSWRNQGLRKPAWAEQIGLDGYGIYASFRVRGITQRLRWIWPGRFLMGSPTQEHNRWDDESQHEVILTRGFWLAETVCTQELWQALMHENPSWFHGLQRPVENVSWRDVQRYIQRLNAEVDSVARVGRASSRPRTTVGERAVGFMSDQQVRLPTEAEWEYACRAGTTTPFSFGEDITPEQVNYDGNYPYRGDKNGLRRRETIDVASLPANPWGLYEMHGNVWEWCQDWYGAYPDSPTVDPLGAETGLTRVVRGESWVNHAKSCRSAQRDRTEPAKRSEFLGFAWPEPGPGSTRTWPRRGSTCAPLHLALEGPAVALASVGRRQGLGLDVTPRSVSTDTPGACWSGSSATPGQVRDAAAVTRSWSPGPGRSEVQPGCFAPCA